MPTSKIFNGPPSNKATAAAVASAAATLFWTIAAHTFWKNIGTADMTLYIATSTVFLTAVIGFCVPESAAYTAHSKQRIDDQAAGRQDTSAMRELNAAIQDLDARVQWSQQLDKAMADRLGIALPPAIAVDGAPVMLARHQS